MADVFAALVGQDRAVAALRQYVKNPVHAYLISGPVGSSLHDAALAFARASGAANMSRVAVTGFCWGGRQAWLYAERTPGLRAAVAWYGPLGYPVDARHPANPPDNAAALKVPVLGLYGGSDKGIPRDAVAAFATKLAAGASGSKIVVYDDAGHAFFADYRPSYIKADADASWKEATAWLKAHGV